jgi:hypothetical protein
MEKVKYIMVRGSKMTKADRIRAIESIITSMEWVKEDDYEEDNYHRLATAIEEAIGVDEDVFTNVLRGNVLGYCQGHPEFLMKAISTNKEVISIKEEHNE